MAAFPNEGTGAHHEEDAALQRLLVYPHQQRRQVIALLRARAARCTRALTDAHKFAEDLASRLDMSARKQFRLFLAQRPFLHTVRGGLSSRACQQLCLVDRLLPLGSMRRAPRKLGCNDGGVSGCSGAPGAARRRAGLSAARRPAPPSAPCASCTHPATGPCLPVRCAPGMPPPPPVHSCATQPKFDTALFACLVQHGARLDAVPIPSCL